VHYNPTKAKQLYQAAGGPASLQISYNADGGHKEVGRRHLQPDQAAAWAWSASAPPSRSSPIC
jgi:hypothetical protein